MNHSNHPFSFIPTYLCVLSSLEAHKPPARVSLDIARIERQGHRAVCFGQVEELQADVGHGSIGPHHGAGWLVGQALAVAGHRILVVRNAKAFIALRLLKT